MFSVGEFSRLAGVSKRLLRYYDEIGLLKPAHIDRLTGYRYYSAEQMPYLNRILALKDLGLTLSQIQQMLLDQVSADEMEGMLLLKKAEIEQHLHEQLQLIRTIEARLQFIRHAEAEQSIDIMVKQIPAQAVLSIRTVLTSLDEGLTLFRNVQHALPGKIDGGHLFSIMHNANFDEGYFDFEIGRFITEPSHSLVPLSGDLQFTFRELPAVEMMATCVIEGGAANLLNGYRLIGVWTEVNHYRFAGLPREIALRMPTKPDWSDGIAEIQFPVEPVYAT